MKTNMIQYFQETVKRDPQRTAVVERKESVTFAELDKMCRRIASGITERQTRQAVSPAAVYLPKSIGSIAADLGILYSGNAYMNLDVKTPMERILRTLERIEPEFVIASRDQETGFLEGRAGAKLLYLEDLLRYEPKAPAALDQRVQKVLDTDPMCVINTSGSTGTPKGVVLSHRSFQDYTEWAISTHGFQEDEVIGSLSPIVFDHFSFELCLLMAKGSTLVILEEAMAAFPLRLLQQACEEQVTFLFWVPTIMVNIANLDLLSGLSIPSLRMVWFAGEVFPTRSFNYWRRSLPGVRFVNLYGPAECTVDCLFYVVERELSDTEPIPIGVPCRNTDILLLKENGEPVADGEEGEICVRGTSLAMGYYRDPEKTAAAFVQNPLNTAYPERIYRTGDLAYRNERGEYIFKGRKDTLIKHLGYRIELSEIEHIASFALKEIRNCCVLYRQEKKEILLVYEAERELDAAEARRRLAEYCPKYMIPVRYLRIDGLPMNTNGKVDRKKVREILGI